MATFLRRKGFLRDQLPAVAWVLLIFLSSSVSRSSFPSINVWWVPKLIHVVYFFFLTLFTYRGLKYQRIFSSIAKNAVLLSVCLTILYAIFDETHQLFVPGRHGRLSDVFIDGFSAALFVFVLWVSTTFQATRRETSPS
jgi:VanZ family protein